MPEPVSERIGVTGPSLDNPLEDVRDGSRAAAEGGRTAIGGVMATRGAMGGGGGGALASGGQKLHPARVSTLGDFTAGGPAQPWMQSAAPAFRNVAELGGEKLRSGHFIEVDIASRPLSVTVGQGKALLPASGPSGSTRRGSTRRACGNGGELTGGGGAGAELEIEVGDLDVGFCKSASLTTELLLLQPIYVIL